MQLEQQGDGRYISGVRQLKEIDMIYAVNKRTKEHLIAEIRPLKNTQWVAIEADEDGWIEWRGGECPLPDDQPCEVKVRGGGLPRGPKSAKAWAWDCVMPRRSSDIIAYRPILDETAQAPKDCVTVRYDLDPANIEGAIREKLIEMGWTPPKSEREEWIEAAIEAHANADYPSNEFEAIYDALKSGELPMPGGM